MSKEELFSLDFDFKGKFPKEMFNKFLETQVNLLGLRGWVKEVDKERIKGHIEGVLPNLDKFKKVMETAEAFASQITQMVFTEVKKIEKYTTEAFEIRK
ncbi:PREDICTED: acylphosphatase-2-like [Rhagoletis zephyria]|uniref:acylphosphatase-2-like n=1 Tax=Rhagoletis zephyria TaxID=28612 RepID=UPI000811714B|nr:PREDICTED: acylphosphatase-2-like [Rhagoletis zephyria]XP_017484908.1 PREDICTED: acylphosphatase-2-like [Rhagoletis zephyria]